MKFFESQWKEFEMISMNLATAVAFAAIVVLVCLSIRTLRRKGTCGHKEHCGGCSGSCLEGCSHSGSDSLAAEVRDRLSRMG